MKSIQFEDQDITMYFENNELSMFQKDGRSVDAVYFVTSSGELEKLIAFLQSIAGKEK